MNRFRIPLSCLFLSSLATACGDDSTAATASDGASGSATESGGTDSQGTDSAATDTASDTMMSNSGTSESDTAATDSQGTSGTDSMSTDSSATSGTDSNTASATATTTDSTATDSGGTGTATDTDGNPGIPVPNRYPGVDTGLCTPPGQIQYCYSGAPATYLVGECEPGIQQCIAEDLDFGQWGECEGEILPGLEVCDGLDNDCDGSVDEDLGETTCGLNQCEHTEPNCVLGVPNECDPFQGAEPEVCDGLDNDCDGDIDEGLGDETETCGLGVCEHTVTACVGGEVPECDPFQGAGPETCDGLDNDCDGQVDEGQPTITCGLGVCEHTIDSCVGGVEQVCDPFEGAGPEICDGLDNDCDGIIDEDQGVWTCGEADCEVTVPQCIDGEPQPESTCEPIPGGEEICGDGIDNNCDGEAPPCAETFVVGTDTEIRPIDVIWAVDSSGSMSQEMATVEAEINSFADALAASGSSTTLHLIADRGTESFEICVQPPLGGAGCADNPAEGFWHYDTNGDTNGVEMVHSSNALGRTMQQSGYWMPRLQPNSHIAFIVTTDDDGDDPEWVEPDDMEPIDDCTSTALITDATGSNLCRWVGPDMVAYTSLAFDHAGQSGFTTFMQNFFPAYQPDEDWSYYSIIGNTGTYVLTGADDIYEFNDCDTSVEDGDEYVKLSLYTNRQDAMISICDADWDLTGLADDIVSGVPNNLFVLEGSPPGNCGLIDPATITVVVNGIPMNPADWTYDAATCTLEILNNIPVVGDTVTIVYENF